MLISYLRRWFRRPANGNVQADRPQVVAPAFAARQPPRPKAAAGGVEVVVTQTPDGMVLRVKGDAGVECAGVLLAGLLAPAALRPAVVTLDLSELRSISSLALGVLVAFRRGVVRIGGRVRLAEGLQSPVREALARAELFDLFEITSDPELAPNHPPGRPQPPTNHPVAV
jgi:anti-anti-sigma factor